MSTTPVIDFDAINASVAKLAETNPDELKAKLEKFRSRQVLQQKKQAAKGGQAAYNAKRMAEYKAMKAQAIALGIWDDIDAKAKADASAKFEEFLDKSLEAEVDEPAEVED
jgi:hypothetical protein